MNTNHTDSVEAVVAEFDEIWELTESLVSNGAIINKHDFKEAWRAKLREVFSTLQANQSQQVEEAVRKERERCIKVVEDYGKSMSELLSEMVGNSHEDSKMMLAYDMHSRLIAVRHITNKLTPNHQD